MKHKKLENGHVLVYNEEVEAKIDGLCEKLLLEAEKCENWGVISPIVLSKNNKIVWHGGYVAPTLNMPMSYGAGEDYIGQFPGTRAVTAVLFLCAIISKDLAEKQGVPEELGENVFDDANYCLHSLANGFNILATDVESVRYLGKDFSTESVKKDISNLEAGAAGFNSKWGDTIRKGFRLPVCYHSRVSAPTGFAVAVGNYMKALSDQGIDVQYSFLFGIPEGEPAPDDMLLTAITEKTPDTNMPQIIWGQAPLFFKNSGRYKIGHCEFEGAEWPRSWVPYCNAMDEVWVPTKWDREKAIKAGVNKPIYIVYQGIDKDYYHPKIAPMKIDVPQSFRFIVTAAWDPRKNLDGLIKTFARTFKKTDDVCLVVKTMNTGLVTSIVEEIKKLNIPEGSGLVYIKEEDWPATHLPAFYNMGHCFVLPTHGEGWGLPVFEALACGVPTITTGWGVPNEVLMDPDDPKKPLGGLHLLDYHIVQAQSNYTYLEDAKWAEPNLQQLAEKMRYVYENYAKEKKAALKTSEYVREKFDWHEVVKPIIDRLDDIYKNKMK